VCTVTYLPSDKNKFILTSSRDEKLNRKLAIPPLEYTHNGQKIIYPKDGEAKGTWIATSENNFTLCLLNGAFEFHQHNPPYKLSRGLMLLDFFNFNNVKEFVEQYDFTGIEPFTLIIINHKNDIELNEIRWDEKGELFLSKKNHSLPHIWFSATLYSKEKILQREKWFFDWLDKFPTYEVNDILHFHHFGGNGDPVNIILMDQEKLKTISITAVTNKNDNLEMIYEDLIQNQTKIFQSELSDKEN